MPLQVGKSRIRAWHSRLGWIIILLMGVLALATTSMADGGHFAQTPHGNPTTGVQRDASLPRGSCVQCHAGHGSSPQEFGLWAANDNNLCFTCHAGDLRSYLGQTRYTGSGHAVSTSVFDGRPVGRCVQCHNPHGAGDTGGPFTHLTGHLEQKNCFACHGSGFRPSGAADVETLASKPYSHRVGDFQRKHDDTAESTSVAVNPNLLLSGSGRHVECEDCHNPHYARPTPRPEGSSNIGEMLLGSWGVRPTYFGSPWTAPTSYTVERFRDVATNYEYYLCLKCHSDWAWGAAAPYTADGTWQTNVAVEFNPSNPAYHNATGQTSSTVPSEDIVDGTAALPGYVSPWEPNSTMACSDCHASDPSSGTRGPHGSTHNFMLKKRFRAQAGAIDNTGRLGTQSDLCFDCHDWNTYGEEGNGSATNFRKESDNLHRKPEHARNGCAQCHSAVPHGFNRKHMIVYVTDPLPYFMGGSTGITSYTHASGGSYSESNCTTTSGCHGN